MEEQETATKIVANEEKTEKSTEETIKDKSPTTPSGTWWGSWISQAKEKSASVLEAVKNDLNEITTAVTETLNLVPTEEELNEEAIEKQQQPESDANSVNFTQVKQSISSSISQFFGTVTDALIPQLDEDDTSEAMMISNDETIVLTGFAKHLKELQENDETYLEEPSKTAEHAEKYRMWLEIVEQDQFTQPRIEKMLQQSHVLNEKYNKFVPDTVSHMNFFKRYLFKKALLEDELASEERKKKEAETIRKQPEPAIVEPPVEEELPQTVTTKQNDKPSGDLDIANFELSEEEQARLLEAYEQEIKEREKKEEKIPEELPKAPKSQKSAKKTSNVQSKSTAVPASTSTKGKNNKDLKNQQQPQKSTQQQKAAKNQPKPVAKDQNKETESSTSDESWEKDFDIQKIREHRRNMMKKKS